jgi:hypothetical protein
MTNPEIADQCAGNRMGVALLQRLAGRTPDIATAVGCTLPCNFVDEFNVGCNGIARVVESGPDMPEIVTVEEYPGSMCPARAAQVARTEIGQALDDLGPV